MSQVESDYAYISYAGVDKPFVDRLSSDLRQAGVKIWVDVDDIPPGSNWQKERERALAESSVILFVLSKRTRISSKMMRELNENYEADARLIFPLIFDKLDYSELPSWLRLYQGVDFYSGYETGLRTLLKGLPDIIRKPGPIEPKVQASRGYVFISYAEEDEEFVASLRSFLKEREYAYWDFYESDRDYHGQFFTELEEKIKEAAAIFSVLSPSWKQSEWTVQEYFFAKEVDTPIFLLKAKELGPTLPIAGRPYIDFVNNIKDGFAKLERELTRKGL